MNKTIKTINVPTSRLIHDESIYPRNEVAPEHVSLLVNSIQTGDKLPNILVDKKTERKIVDGIHRFYAYRKLGIKSVNVDVVNASTREEMLRIAIGVNRQNGRPLDRHDIGGCIIKLKKLGVEVKTISSIVKVPLDSVQTIIKNFAFTPVGEPLQLKRGLEKWRGRTLTEKQVKIVNRHAGVNGTFFVEQLISMIEAKIFPDTERFVERMDALIKLWGKTRLGKVKR